VSDYTPMTPVPLQPAPSGGSGVKVWILFGAVIALLIANGYLFYQLDRVRMDVSKTREALATEIANLRETSSVTTQTSRRNLDTLRDELETARRQASMAAGQAKVEAQKHADDLARRLETEQKKAQQAVQGEISQVRETASATSSKLGEVSTEVGSVKTEVAATRGELEKTIADLKRVTGDLGMQSGLIATNSKEIGALRALGDRNIFEFNLGKTRAPQKIGDVAVQLKRTDPKKNTYTIDLVADDKKVEKKDKGINEPVQFIVSKAPGRPYEIIVNVVKKDVIVGYLSTPKVASTR
jgi:chromosome segregation ATPase